MELNTVFQIVAAALLVYIIAKWKNSTVKLPKGTATKKSLPIFGNMLPIVMNKIGIFDIIEQLYYEFTNKKFVD
jgi:hypothetical protein